VALNNSHEHHARTSKMVSPPAPTARRLPGVQSVPAKPPRTRVGRRGSSVVNRQTRPCVSGLSPAPAAPPG
jgi:hypothetical protein